VLALGIGFLLGTIASWTAVAGTSTALPARIYSNVYWNGYQSSYPAPRPPESVLEDLLWETYTTLTDRYLAPEELNQEDLLYGAIKGLINAAGDPYTSFFTPMEAKQFLEDASGHFEGIGAEIGFRDGFLTVISPLEGSPAKGAGLASGDIILEVDGADTREMTLEEAVSLIRGNAGSDVVLRIFRDGETDARNVTITRQRIEIPTLTYKQLEDGVVIIELYNFSEDAPLKFRERIGDIVTQGTNGLILDLRNNPGGFLDASVEIAELFLENGEVSVIERQRDVDDIVFTATRSGPLRDVPTVVLVNGGSASAAEILAGALRDNRGSLLVGTTTFGKGTVQEFPRLTGGAALKVTTGEWLTPAEVSLRGGGLVPDIEVEDDPDTPEDEVLEAGIKALLGE